MGKNMKNPLQFNTVIVINEWQFVTLVFSILYLYRFYGFAELPKNECKLGLSGDQIYKEDERQLWDNT